MDELAKLAGADPAVLEGTSSVPDAVIRTEGEARDSGSGDSGSMTDVLVGTGVILGLAGFAVWRSRHAVRAQP
jgi:hypothetical protein